MRRDSSAVYRERIYARYSSARGQDLAPSTLAGLRLRLPYLEQMIRRHVPSDRSSAILEVGCGHGVLLYALQQAGYHNALGVDGSGEQVEAAARLGIEGVEQGDVFETLCKTPDASLDVLIAFDLIEHFTKTELIALIDEACRVLKPEGRWIIHVPNAEAPFGMGVRYGDFTHELAFTRLSLAQVLLSSGFVKVNCYEDRPVSHGLKSTIRAGLWALIRAGLLFYVAVETGAFDRKAVFSQNLLAVAMRGA